VERDTGRVCSGAGSRSISVSGLTSRKTTPPTVLKNEIAGDVRPIPCRITDRLAQAMQVFGGFKAETESEDLCCGALGWRNNANAFYKPAFRAVSQKHATPNTAWRADTGEPDSLGVVFWIRRRRGCDQRCGGKFHDNIERVEKREKNDCTADTIASTGGASFADRVAMWTMDT